MKKRSKNALIGVGLCVLGMFFSFPLNLVCIAAGIYYFWAKGVFG